MDNYMFINFFARKSSLDPTRCSIYVRVTINNHRQTLGAVTAISGLDIPKSIMISCEHWDKKQSRVNSHSPHASVINKAIVECEQKLQKLYAQHEGFDMTMTTNGTKSWIRAGGNIRPTFPELIEKFLAERQAIGTRKSTIETYTFKLRPLTAFLKHEAITTQAAEDFTPGTLRRYRTYLIVHRSNSERNADKSCQVVKTILLWAAGNEIIRKNPLINIRVRVDKTPNLECLTQDELAIVREAKLTPVLRMVADCFEFACYTGLAYQDMLALTPASVQVVEGERCIVGKRLKTGTRFYIPISERVQMLMEKYKGINLPLPKLGDYNAAIRQIVFILDIPKRITSHTARKTFADWCINELDMSEEATIVAMGQKAAKELTPYRQTRPKRLMSEFPKDQLPSPKEAEQKVSPTPDRSNPFVHIHRAS